VRSCCEVLPGLFLFTPSPRQPLTASKNAVRALRGRPAPESCPCPLWPPAGLQRTLAGVPLLRPPLDRFIRWAWFSALSCWAAKIAGSFTGSEHSKAPRPPERRCGPRRSRRSNGRPCLPRPTAGRTGAQAGSCGDDQGRVGRRSAPTAAVQNGCQSGHGVVFTGSNTARLHSIPERRCGRR
jgi:hypothetical protein